MSTITTHVLDTSIGLPAKGIHVQLFVLVHDTIWEEIAGGDTNTDGRIQNLLPESIKLEKGIYKMSYQTEAYFKSQNIQTFYPYINIVFRIENELHYHIPLLLNPFGYSTYRGS